MNKNQNNIYWPEGEGLFKENIRKELKYLESQHILI